MALSRGQSITVYCFGGGDFAPQIYTYKDKLRVSIYDDFTIDFNKLNI